MSESFSFDRMSCFTESFFYVQMSIGIVERLVTFGVLTLEAQMSEDGMTSSCLAKRYFTIYS